MSSKKHGLETDEKGHVSSKRVKQEDVDSAFSDSFSEDSEPDEAWEPKGQKRSLPKKKSGSPSKTPKAKLRVEKPAAVRVSSKASILSLASNVEPGRQDATVRLASVDNAVLGKIKKALALGGHEATGEAEAKRAMRLAAKLMAQHNVDQADILSAEQDSEKLKRAGQSTVSIKSTTPTQGVVVHSWASTAAEAMDGFFDCKSYSTRIGNYARAERIDWTFYGLCEQTVTAAFAFEMVYNLVLTWSAQNKKAKGRTGKNTYCHGVADGLLRLAWHEKEEEERLTIEKERKHLEDARVAEEQESKRAVKRLMGGVTAVKKEASDDGLQRVKQESNEVNIEEVRDVDMPPPRGVKNEASDDRSTTVKREPKQVKIEEVLDADIPPTASASYHRCDPRDDSGSDDDGGFTRDGSRGGHFFEAEPDFQDTGDGDVDWMLHELDEDVKPALSTRASDSVEQEDTPWTSAQQLTLFRNNASRIADDYLKQNDIKLGTSRYLGPKLENTEDMKIYKQGRDDAKNIDVKRKRIKDVDED